MSATVFLIVLAVVLFVVSFTMRRRFGVLGLALAAGALIATYGTRSATSFLLANGFQVTSPQVETVLTLLPALLLLVGGPVYAKVSHRIIGSIAFVLLAVAFVLRPLGSMLKFDPLGMTIFMMIDKYQPLIIVIGLCLAVIDAAIGRSPKTHSRKAGH